MDERVSNIENIIARLDITPTMYHYAENEYKKIADFLFQHGIEAAFYTQGSFRTGTIVRPLKDGKDYLYDLDVVCELNYEKQMTDAKFVKMSIGNQLSRDNYYKTKLHTENMRCWTLEYKFQNSAEDFALDVVPSVHQEQKIIDLLLGAGIPDGFANKAIAITELVDVEKSHYRWRDSNPAGYGDWFDLINKRFLDYNRGERRQKILNENKELYASIEEIPSNIERTPLQRVIQILKRHRDVYYSHGKMWDKRPISAIITTLVAHIAKNASSNMGMLELLEYVVKELETYVELLKDRHPGLNEAKQLRNLVLKEGNIWKILNPVNSYDNYADYWDNDIASTFFKWIDTIQADFLQGSQVVNDKYYAQLKNAFGGSLVEAVIPESKRTPPIIQVSKTKPWGYKL